MSSTGDFVRERDFYRLQCMVMVVFLCVIVQTVVLLAHISATKTPLPPESELESGTTLVYIVHDSESIAD